MNSKSKLSQNLRAEYKHYYVDVFCPKVCEIVWNGLFLAKNHKAALETIAVLKQVGQISSGAYLHPTEYSNDDVYEKIDKWPG